MRSRSGKKAFITGGSSGIGRSMAIQLAREGAHVFVAARGQAALDETVEAMRAVAPSADQRLGAVSVDVQDRAAVNDAARTVLDTLGGLDLLINNSGYAQCGASESLSDEVFDNIMGVNYHGHVNVTKAFLPWFIKQGSGDIMLVTSMLGFMGFYGYGPYAASKFAIVGFAECLRQEMLVHGVRVGLFYPPTTDTPGLERENEDKPSETWAIEGMSKAFSSDVVGAAILDGMDRGRFVNMVGFDNWAIYYAYRFVPGVVRWVIDTQLKRHLAKSADKAAPTPS